MSRAVRFAARSFSSPPPFLSPPSSLRLNDHSRHFNDLLSSCKSLFSLQQIQAQIVTHGFSLHVALSTKLLSLSSFLSPTTLHARRVFDSLPNPDAFAWNSLIRGYANLGPFQEVPILYQRMHRAGLSPDNFTFPFVIRSCSALFALSEGKITHCDAFKHGFCSNIYVQSSLITMYSSNGVLPDAVRVFEKIDTKNVVSWTSMIAGYAQNQAHMGALGVFRSMVESKEKPNELTLVSVLPACDSVEHFYLAKTIHGFAVKSGFGSFASLVNALIAGYGKCGCFKDAYQLFEEMPKRSLASYNTLIALYDQHGSGDKAIKLFQNMLLEKKDFDSVTLVSVLSACTNMAAIDTGQRVHELARIKGLESDFRVGNALLDMYAKCGSLDSAWEVFEQMPMKDVVPWTAMIGGYASHGYAEEALSLFSEMEYEEIRPNSFTFTAVLAACMHAGLVEEGVRNFNSMIKKYGVLPTLQHSTCLVDLLSRSGRLRKAFAFVKKMNLEPDVGVWGAFLGGCRIHRDVEMAEVAFSEIFGFEFPNATLSLLMSTIYAEAGRWEDAERLRLLMKELELKKAPGCSSLEGDKR